MLNSYFYLIIFYFKIIFCFRYTSQNLGSSVSKNLEITKKNNQTIAAPVTYLFSELNQQQHHLIPSSKIIKRSASASTELPFNCRVPLLLRPSRAALNKFYGEPENECRNTLTLYNKIDCSNTINT